MNNTFYRRLVTPRIRKLLKPNPFRRFDRQLSAHRTVSVRVDQFYPQIIITAPFPVLVLINGSGVVGMIDNEVKVAVIIEIGIG
ncbi:MAG: hypothetical protein R2788_04550 [Saprospiraceae bacterium]